MLSLIQWTIIYAFIYSSILFYLLLKNEKYRNKCKINFPLKLYFHDFMIGIVLFYLPICLYITFNIYSYPNPDTYGYVIASYLEPWDSMPIDPFYKKFPIYIILNKFISFFTGLNYQLSIRLLHCSSLLLVFLGPILLIRSLNNENIFKVPFLMIYASTFITTIYLYSYFNIIIPQIFGIWLIILMFYMLYRDMIIPFIFFSILALIHFSIIPLFLIFFLFQLIFKRLLMPDRLNKTKVVGVQKSLIALLIPFIVHFIYSIHYYGARSLLPYVEYYLRIFYDIFSRPEYAGLTLITASTGIQRQFPFLSALATGSFLSILFTGFVLFILKKERYSHVAIALMILGALLTAIGISRYYITIYIPSMSVARYVNVPGFYFLSIFAAYTLNKIFNKRFCKNVYYFTFIILSVGVVASFFDPLTFPFKPSVEDSVYSQIISRLYDLSTYSVSFLTEKDNYYLGPQLAYWTFLEQKRLPHFSHTIDAFPDKMYINIIFSMKTHNIYSAENIVILS